MKRVGVVGLGLIGGSVASGLKKRNLVEHIIAYDQDTASLASALETGVIDSAASSVLEAVKDVDTVIVAVPVLGVEGILAQIPINKIITDVGSVKVPIIEALDALPLSHRGYKVEKVQCHDFTLHFLSILLQIEKSKI